MLKLYKYLYYRIYSRKLKGSVKSDMPEWTAVLIISLMMFVNLIFLGLLLELIGIRVISGEVHTEIIYFILIGIAGLNYYLFMHSGKYKTIIKEFEEEDARNRKSNTILLWLYIILSFLFLIILMIYLRE